RPADLIDRVAEYLKLDEQMATAKGADKKALLRRRADAERAVAAAAQRRIFTFPVAGGIGLNSDTFFLWSLEQTAMLLDLERIGGKDWSAWGAAALVLHQQKDGSWHHGAFGGPVDTCFALLFLKRTSPALDPGKSSILPPSKSPGDLTNPTPKGPGSLPDPI